MRGTGRLVLAMVVVLALALAACAPAATPTPTPTKAPPPAAPTKPAEAKPTTPPAPTPTTAPAGPSPTVRVTFFGIMTDAGLIFAQEKGYFQEQGLKIELVKFDAAPAVIQALAGGHLEVGKSGMAAALFNSAARGVDMRIVADSASTTGDDTGLTWLVARKDLYDSGALRTLKDLKGKKVGINTLGAIDERLMGMNLASAGLRDSDIEYVIMAWPDMIVALEKKAIDVASTPEPFALRMAQAGVGVRWMPSDKILPQSTFAAIIYSPEWADKNPDPARRFMVAYVKGLRYYNEAFLARKNRAEAIQALIKYLPLKEARDYDEMLPPGLNPDGYVNRDSVAGWQDWFAAKGVVQQKADINKLVDHRYVDEALKALGPYKR